jgi:hypothetical protein
MNFRYDFVGDKLDLTRYTKQAIAYIGAMREVDYTIYFKHYKMRVEIARLADSTAHAATVYFFELRRDDAGEIINEKVIIPATDTRFKESQSIKDLWGTDHYKAHFDSSSSAATVEKINKVIKLIYKIENLKAFI